MSVIRNTVRGAIKVDNLPDRACFTTYVEFINALPQYLTVEVPNSITNVIIGSSPPGEDDKDKLWLRRDNSGRVIGLYTFQNGAWRPFDTSVVPGVINIKWVVGNSANIPDGYILIESGNTDIPSNVVQSIIAQYVPNTSGGFSYFAIQYIGV